MKPKEELRVEAIFPYDARRPDEMSFYVGDVIRVSQIQPDGMFLFSTDRYQCRNHMINPNPWGYYFPFEQRCPLT